MIVYLLLIFITLTWLILLTLPLLISSLNTGIELSFKWYYTVFSLICHQQPERSYFIQGYQLPVCARCLGIYAGLFIGPVIYPIFKSVNNKKIPHPKWIALFLFPIFIDGVFQSFNLYDSGNYFRTIMGLTASTPMIFYIIPLLNQIYCRIKNISKKQRFR